MALLQMVLRQLFDQFVDNDLAAGSCLVTFHGHMAAITSLRIDFGILVSGDMAGCLRVWDLQALSLLRVLGTGLGVYCEHSIIRDLFLLDS
jgi:hypothetical protein